MHAGEWLWRNEIEEVTVYYTQQEYMADMAVGLLEGDGITAVKVFQLPGNYLPFPLGRIGGGGGVGGIGVRIAKEDYDRAVELLAARFSDYSPPPFD